MELKVKAYDKVAVVSVSGKVTIEEVAQLIQELPPLVKQFQFTVVSFRKAEMTETLMADFLKVREKEEVKTAKFLVVAEIKGADFPEVSKALESFKTTDTLRVAEIFRTSLELKKLKKDCDKLRLSYQNLLRSSLSVPESDELLDDEKEQVLRLQLNQQTEKLNYLFRVLGKEIEKVLKDRKQHGEVEISNDSKTQLSDLRASALDALKKAGVI